MPISSAVRRAVFAPDELIAALDAAGVEYVLIGGLAVAAHGFPRATKDIDIVPSPDPANLSRLARLLMDLGTEIDGADEFDPGELPVDPLDPAQLAQGGHFVLRTRLGRLDIMQWVLGIEADNAYELLARDALRSSVGGHEVQVTSLAHLVTMKRSAGRPQDLEDLRRLGVLE